MDKVPGLHGMQAEPVGNVVDQEKRLFFMDRDTPTVHRSSNMMSLAETVSYIAVDRPTLLSTLPSLRTLCLREVSSVPCRQSTLHTYI